MRLTPVLLDDPIQYLPVATVIALLQQLPPDALIVPNRVRNLAVYQPTVVTRRVNTPQPWRYYGFVDFEGGGIVVPMDTP